VSTLAHAPFPGVAHSGDWPRPRGWARPERLQLPLESLAAVGPSLARKLRPLGLLTVGDLLLRRPRRYEAAADEIAISELWGDEEVAIAGVVENVRLRRLPGRRSIVTARIADATGPISANWFNQPWLADRLKPGTTVRLRGRLSKHGFEVKTYDLGEARATADHAPVYRASEQVPAARLRELVRGALDEHAHGSGSRSTSCSHSSSQCCAHVSRAPSAARFPSPASSWLATGACSRSS
jgi:ATP-dependent DNA helicase RecG